MKFLNSRILLLVLLLQGVAHAESWWNAEWTLRKKITIDTSDKGVAISDAVGGAVLLIRLHDGVYDFAAGKEDGSDLRFVAEDGKTVLKHHIEKWDTLLNEGYIWVRVPEIKPSSATTIWLYYGKTGDGKNVGDAKGTYDAETALVYHFADAATVATDSSASALALQNATPPMAGSFAAGGQRLLGQAAVTIPEGPATEWAAGSALTWSAWLKPAALAPNAVVFSRRDGANALLIGLDNGVPFVDVNGTRSSVGAAVSAGVWHHVALVAKEDKMTVYLDGAPFGTLATALPALKGPSLIGKDSAPGTVGFVGELDELQVARTARSESFLKFAAVSQGTGADAAKLVVLGNDEASDHAGGGEIMKHLSLITDISKSLTFDGWVVIALCFILAVVGWAVALGKFLYLNKISKSNKAFLERWENVSSDLTVLDQEDGDTIKTLGGTASGKAQKLMRHSPLYHIYHLGSEEVQKRLQSVRKISLTNTEKYTKGLSGRSIQAIKATLHGGMVREVQKLNGKLVFLTIGIAGGPYLGLLGTVIGVMITCAVIAKSGQVEVNSIAPGIAGALLATVAGLAVAIPALFAYSYLASRIKDVVSNIETFIDEFIAKMAEHHKETN
ncbi:MAG: MotA/TolQ/ExbB proton channel family protein [Verrucomicrobiaceae bacterium]